MTPRTVCFDLDGTLCTNTWGAYDEAQPLPWAVAILNELADAGHRIVIHTARGTTTGIDWRPATEGQLAAWGVRFDELHFGKPQADVYVDDRTHHVDAWRSGVARRLDGDADDRVPILPPPRGATLLEIGRTAGGVPYALDAHVAAAVAGARTAGIALDRPAAELAAALRSALDAAAEELPDGDDLIFTLAVAAPPHPAYADTLDGRVEAELTVGCRRIGQLARGISGWLRPDGVAARTDGGDGWPLRAGDPLPADALGGQVAGCWDRVLVLDERDVAGAEVAAAARAAGLEVRAGAPVDAPPSELLLVAMPFLALPIVTLDDRPAGVGGPVATALRGALERRLGLDPVGQLLALAR